MTRRCGATTSCSPTCPRPTSPSSNRPSARGSSLPWTPSCTWRKESSPSSTKRPPPNMTQDFVDSSGKVKLARRLIDWAGLSSKAEAERLIKQGAVEIDGAVISDPAYEIDLSQPREFTLRV